MYKEWEWDGPIPLDKRIPLFVGLVNKNVRHNLTFESTVPRTGTFRL